MHGDLTRALWGGPHELAAYLDPSYQRPAHIHYIAETALDALSRPGARLAVITPPQVGKSSLCAMWLPLWLLALKPASRIITASYNQRLANRNGRMVRNLVRDFGEDLGIELASDARSVSEWYLTGGGGLKSVGVGAGVTGFAGSCLRQA